jgi:hypothetical protein
MILQGYIILKRRILICSIHSLAADLYRNPYLSYLIAIYKQGYLGTNHIPRRACRPPSLISRTNKHILKTSLRGGIMIHDTSNCKGNLCHYESMIKWDGGAWGCWTTDVTSQLWSKPGWTPGASHQMMESTNWFCLRFRFIIIMLSYHDRKIRTYSYVHVVMNWTYMYSYYYYKLLLQLLNYLGMYVSLKQNAKAQELRTICSCTSNSFWNYDRYYKDYHS